MAGMQPNGVPARGARSQTKQSKQTKRTQPQVAAWSEPALRQAVQALWSATIDVAYPRGHAVPAWGQAEAAATVEAIVQLGLQAEIQTALNERCDTAEAIRDLATRYAFAQAVNCPHAPLDHLSQVMVARTLARIDQAAERAARMLGENPLDEDQGLVQSLYTSIAKFEPRKPIWRHIQYKVGRYESAASRCIRQIANLVHEPRVRCAFAEFANAHVQVAHLPAYLVTLLVNGVAAAETADATAPMHPQDAASKAVQEFRQGLIRMARGGTRTGLPVEATIRFFALPETVGFVKQFATWLQPARTLYAVAECADLPWAGRKLPATCRWGYLEAALAQFERQHPAAAFTPDDDGDGGSREPADLQAETRLARVLHSATFPQWVVATVLEAHPADPFWQVMALLYRDELPPAAVIAAGQADAATVAAAQARMAALQADPELWQTWLETTLC